MYFLIGIPLVSHFLTLLLSLFLLARPPVDLLYQKRVQVNDPNKLFAADVARRFIDSCWPIQATGVFLGPPLLSFHQIRDQRKTGSGTNG